MILLVLACLAVWIYLLWVFKRAKLDFFEFCFGSVGLFIFSTILIEPIITPYLVTLVAFLSGIVGNLTHLYSSYFQYGMLFINNSVSTISLYINYECSGVIEILAFLSLLWFYSIYNVREKIVVSIIGTMWIILANTFRIFFICIVIYFGGNDLFYLAHTIFGRIVFYGLSVALYFYVFTRPHILRQKVERFVYGNVS